MAGLENLLKYKDKVSLRNPKTGKTIKTVWVRILGDDDLKEAFKYARIASAEKRAQLRDKDSDIYKDEISDLSQQPRENLEELILASRENAFANEAPVIIEREELPEIEQIAVQPDAPTLEEQERLDTEVNTQQEKFKKAIEEYIQTKLNEVKAELKDASMEKIVELAIVDYTNVQALQAFLDELNQQKGFRGTYTDEACTNRGFDTIEDFKNAHGSIKVQLIEAYNNLDMGSDDIKN